MSSRYHAGDQPVPGFVLKAKLGEGSFGSVWSATGPGGSEVAVKFISLQRAYGDKELRALRLVKRIRHPHVVPLTGFWLLDENGRLIDEATAQNLCRSSSSAATLVCDETSKAAELIVVMGLGDMSLDDRLRECQQDGMNGIPVEELLRYMEDAARAIDFLNKKQHSSDHGLVAIQHCDIKPQNILIVGGLAQVCDLGLARILDDARQTRAAFSAAYGAPECLTGSSPSPGTDQYSLAVSYIELRTGQLPFEDTSSHARVIQAHLDSRLDLSRLSSREQAVIRRATSIDPADRFESVSAMVAALRCAVESRLNPKRPTFASFRRRAAILLTLAAAIFVGFVSWKHVARDGKSLVTAAEPAITATNADQHSQPKVSSVGPEVTSTSLVIVEAASVLTLPVDEDTSKSASSTDETDSSENAPQTQVEAPSPSFVWKWVGRKTENSFVAVGSGIQSAFSAVVTSAANLRHLAIRQTFEQGLKAAKAGDEHQAIQRFSSILTYDHLHVPSHIQRGLSMARLGKIDEALRDYSLAIDVESENADARRLRGIAWARKGQYIDALHDLNVAIQKNSEPLATCYRTRALVRAQLEDYIGALSDQAEVKKRDRNMLLVLTLRVAKKDAFAELGSGGNFPIEIGKSLKLLGASEQRLRIEFLDDETTNSGWIHQSFVKPVSRL